MDMQKFRSSAISQISEEYPKRIRISLPDPRIEHAVLNLELRSPDKDRKAAFAAPMSDFGSIAESTKPSRVLGNASIPITGSKFSKIVVGTERCSEAPRFRTINEPVEVHSEIGIIYREYTALVLEHKEMRTRVKKMKKWKRKLPDKDLLTRFERIDSEIQGLGYMLWLKKMFLESHISAGASSAMAFIPGNGILSSFHFAIEAMISKGGIECRLVTLGCKDNAFVEGPVAGFFVLPNESAFAIPSVRIGKDAIFF